MNDATSSSSFSHNEMEEGLGVAKWCTPELHRLNPELFGSHDATKQRKHMYQQAKRIQQEILQEAQKEAFQRIMSMRRKNNNTNNDGKSDLFYVRNIGRYQGVGSKWQKQQREAKVLKSPRGMLPFILMIVCFAGCYYGLIASILNLAGISGEALLVGTVSVGLVGIFVADKFGLWPIPASSSNQPSELMTANQVSKLINGTAAISNNTSKDQTV